MFFIYFFIYYFIGRRWLKKKEKKPPPNQKTISILYLCTEEKTDAYLNVYLNLCCPFGFFSVSFRCCRACAWVCRTQPNFRSATCRLFIDQILSLLHIYTWRVFV